MVFGLEDDIEIFKDEIVDIFSIRVNVDFFILDKIGNKFMFIDEIFFNELMFDEVKLDDIYFNIVNVMVELFYDFYIVLIGVRYGVILNFEDFELILIVGV